MARNRTHQIKPHSKKKWIGISSLIRLLPKLQSSKLSVENVTAEHVQNRGNLLPCAVLYISQSGWHRLLPMALALRMVHGESLVNKYTCVGHPLI